MYRVGIDKAPGTVIMKACRTEGICKREAAELTLLGQDSLIHVPEVYFTFAATEELPVDFICMERVEGTDGFTDFSKLLCPKKEKAAFADAVTDALLHWHSRTNARFGLIGNAVYDTWLDYYRPFAEDILKRARELATAGKLEKKVLAAMERAGNAFDSIFSEKVETASLIHGDLNVMNIFYEVYAYILSGNKVNFILAPLVKRMDRTLDRFGL